MTEQECLKALCRIQCGAKQNKKCEDCECFDDKVNIWKCVENTQESLVLRQLIREHFELEQNFKILEKNYDDIYDIVHCPEPYKFEDLKVGIWVWDIIWEECFEICEIFPKDNEIHVLIHQNRINVKRYEPIKFEEGRFYPVTKALEYQE